MNAEIDRNIDRYIDRLIERGKFQWVSISN